MKNSSIYPCHLPDLICQGRQGQAPMSLTVKTFRQPDETELRTPCHPSLKKFAHEGDLYLYPSGYPASPLPPTKFAQVLLPPLPASCGTITLPCNPPPSGKKKQKLGRESDSSESSTDISTASHPPSPVLYKIVTLFYHWTF